MKLRIWWALATGVILESIRRKDLWVVAILGFLIMMAASVLGFFGIDGLQIFVKDLSVSVLSAFGAILAILTASRMLPDEIRQRTLYPLLARPISRFDLLMGKLMGAVVVSWIGFLVLTALTALALATFHVGFEPIMAQYVLCKLMGLVVICALSLALSAYMTPAAAATMAFVLTFGSSMIIRSMTMGFASAGPGVQWTFKLINAVLPQVTIFDLGGRAANQHWPPVALWVVGFLFGYMVVYTSGMLSLAWIRFRRQAI